MRFVENAANIIVGKRWLHQTINSFLYRSIRQHSFMSILFQKKMNKCHNVKDYVKLAFSTSNIKPVQVREEITELLEMVAINKPKFVLEIGTAGGGTLFLLSRVASPDASIISLDLLSGVFGGGYPSQKIPFFRTFATQDQKMYFVRENSHLLQTFHSVEGILKGHKLDFLLIDGDHTYNGVKKDFEMYSKLVKKGGMIAFHDIVPGNFDSVGGVPRYWNEIKPVHSSYEIVEDWNQDGYGIGILYIDRSS
jgi:predicted O-methyltransferase YrrM